MTQEVEPKRQAEAAIPLGKAEYFVELNTPHRWSSGPTIYEWDPQNRSGIPFASLEEAKAFAEREHNPSYEEDCVQASYGVRYVTQLDRRPPEVRERQEREAAAQQSAVTA